MESKLKDPAFVGKLAKFVKASEKGWTYARANDKEAAKIVIAADTTGAQTLHHQEQMMGEIGKLLDTANGELDPKDYDRTVSELLSGGSDPVITKKPTGAWTHAVYEAMK
jgi:NitT/TauT family transport system substrate-binding protein